MYDEFLKPFGSSELKGGVFEKTSLSLCSYHTRKRMLEEGNYCFYS